jgi:hypothetical protein
VGPVNLSYTKPFKGEEGIGTYTYTVLKDGTHNQSNLVTSHSPSLREHRFSMIFGWLKIKVHVSTIR